MKIIAFSGVDGSGKTTQRELLQQYLEREGKKVLYFHATEFSLANRLARRLKGKKEFIPGTEKAVSHASFSSVFLRLSFLLLDAVRFEFYKEKQKKNGVDYILSDRFFQDSLINAAYLSQNPLLETFIKSIAAALPIPDKTFYLKVSVEDLLSRGRVAEQGEEYLKEKINLYNNPSFPWAYETLNGTESKEILHSSIVEKLH